jgi:predicted phage terminase large subunit-like protein
VGIVRVVVGVTPNRTILHGLPTTHIGLTPLRVVGRRVPAVADTLPQSETLRQNMRQMAQASLYFLAKAVLGFDKFTPHLHKEVCEFLTRPERRKLLVLPRGHYKTTISTISYPIWLSINDTNIRILLASSTTTNAQKMLGLIRAKWERCDMLRWLFPECVPDTNGRWNDSCATIARSKDFPEGTYEAIGAGGTAVSRHYDVIIEDDLVNEDHLISKEQMDKVIDWHQYKESLFVSPGKGVDVLIGTRWAHYDLLYHVMDQEPDRIRYVRSATENGVPIFPEEFTLQELERLLTIMGPYKYSCQYLNDPTQDTARKFEEQWLRYYDLLPQGPWAYYVACDPAASVFRAGGGAVRDSDYTALVTVAVNPEGDKYVCDVVCDRLGVDEFIYELFRVVETYRPRTVGIETNAFQRALLFPIKQEMKRSNTFFNITELKASRAATKQLRILALQPYFANGNIYVRKQDKELLHEYRLFPLAKHDDVLDALAYAVQLAKPSYHEVYEVKGHTHPLSFDSIEKDINKRRVLSRTSPWTHVNRWEVGVGN